MAIQKKSPRQPDNTDVEVGRLVKALRIANGLSQTELGNRIGVSFQMVQKYESGANRISMGRLARIAQMFGIPVTSLLGGIKEESALKPGSGNATKYVDSVEMLGRSGAQRLLTAFAAVPSKPAKLRESIVHMVERIAAEDQAGGARKRTKRR